MKFILNSYYKTSSIVSKIWNFIEDKFGVPNKPSALPLRFMGNNEDYCWEDYHKDEAKNYPIRHFIFHNLSGKVSSFFYIYVENKLIWINSRYFEKEHLIDMRGLIIDDYRKTYKGGYIDAKSTLELSMQKSFIRFMKRQHKSIEEQIAFLEKYNETASDEEKPYREKDIKILKNFKEIRDFFEIEKPLFSKEKEDLWDKIKSSTKEDKRLIFKKINDKEKLEEERTTEILAELIKIRTYLNTF